MTFKIFFTIDEQEDFFFVEGDSIEEIREAAKAETDKRGLEAGENCLRSEKCE